MDGGMAKPTNQKNNRIGWIFLYSFFSLQISGIAQIIALDQVQARVYSSNLDAGVSLAWPGEDSFEAGIRGHNIFPHFLELLRSRNRANNPNEKNGLKGPLRRFFLAEECRRDVIALVKEVGPADWIWRLVERLNVKLTLLSQSISKKPLSLLNTVVSGLENRLRIA